MLRALVRLGHAGDERVARACESLLSMGAKPGETFAGRTISHPSWCAHTLRYRLEAIARGKLSGVD